ncbi:hypothetical protein M422DRAFT_267733 [Sphaerobolus stellatus SS14]|uniref:Ubiquitin-like protease family profile domain-containing protein n=1 Tax=Sphaerobolus stellatus (strain SS14) TaxID=990650 RepID=A0A0C9UP52_SPHS4|nr:hypothetical protein M422DRAFT_267733 [Sphaerobolus stellatus SS14]
MPPNGSKRTPKTRMGPPAGVAVIYISSDEETGPTQLPTYMTPPRSPSPVRCRWRRDSIVIISSDDETSSTKQAEQYLSYLSTGTAEGARWTRVPLVSLARLDPGCWLDDHLVEMGLSLWFERFTASCHSTGRLKVLSSFFFTNYTARGYPAVAHWTKRWSPFDFDLIVIPVHDVNHWFSCVIIGARNSIAGLPTKPPIDIISMDSLAIERASARDSVSAWLIIEFNKKFPKEHHRQVPSIVSRDLPVPQQPNFFDCGLYMIHYVNHFVRHSNSLLQALNSDSSGYQDPGIWRTDLALHARSDFAVHVRRYARMAYESESEARTSS